MNPRLVLIKIPKTSTRKKIRCGIFQNQTLLFCKLPHSNGRKFVMIFTHYLGKQTSYWSKTGSFFSVKKVNNIFVPNYRDIITN